VGVGILKEQHQEGGVMDRPIVQCMGGWCKKREQCAHYWAAPLRMRAPVERLCEPGHDDPEEISTGRNVKHKQQSTGLIYE
jgi:hypothetical protein